jgi:hypothetical protein
VTLEAIASSPTLAGMRALPNWVVYAVAPDPEKPGKLKKQPLGPRTGYLISVTDPKGWTDFETAAAAARLWGGAPNFGVGFCFTRECGYWFLDLDSCALPNGEWSTLAQQMVLQAFPGAAVEVSVSGKGLHLFGRGEPPPHSNRNKGYSAEFYTADRFCALSGTSLAGNCDTDHTAALAWLVPTYFPPKEASAGNHGDGPRPDWRGPTDDQELIRRALMSRSAAGVFGGKASFADLWHADERVLAGAFPPDNTVDPFNRSNADAALLAHLAFWTGADGARMGALLKQSGLARGKHDREDYLARSIEFAVTHQKDVLQDKLPEPPPGPPSVSTTETPGMRAVEGSTFLGPADQVTLFKGCAYITDQHRVLVPGGNLLKPEQFNAKFGGYTFVMDGRNERTTRKAFEAFTESQVLRASKVDNTVFRPKLPFGTIVTESGRTYANTWWPASVARKTGDPTLFTNHLQRLLPHGKDAAIALAYLAACVQHQGTKFTWAIVLQGVEGNGKTVLSRCVARAVGDRYVHWPKASKIAKQFNAWLLGKVVYLVEDVFVQGQDVIDELKPMIAGGSGLEIEAKGVDQVSAEVCGNFILNTNRRNGVPKTRNDRRFCWLSCAQQDVDDLARDGMTRDYFTRLYDWLHDEDGYAIVSEFLHTYPIPYELDPAGGCQRAPVTTTTADAIERSVSPVEQAILDAVEQGVAGFRGGWISTTAVTKLLRDARLNVSRSERADAFRALGYVKHPALTDGQVDNPVLPDGARTTLYVKPSHSAAQIARGVDVARAYSAAQAAG